MGETRHFMPRGRLRAIAKQHIAKFDGNISADALDLLLDNADKVTMLAIESAWVCVTSAGRKTILKHDAKKGIDISHNLFAPDILEGLIWRLKEIKKEVEGNDKRRTDLFESDGRGRKARKGNDAELEKCVKAAKQDSDS